MDETMSTLTDGETYTDPPEDEDQKAAFFSEGQLLFSGNGTLVVYGLGDDQHGLGSDDGMNATYGSDVEGDDGSMLTINGGVIDVSASTGDGIDSNGSLTITGGPVIVHGSPSHPDVAADINGDFLIDGGFVALGIAYR